MGNVLKIIITGLITTAVRIIGQLSIPAGEQTVLGPSVFAQNGTMPMVFCIYGVFAYSIIASMFLLIRDTLSGNRLLQGLKYGAACTVVWTVYLWEPLPHVAPMDRITYPLADSLALLVMGLLLGAFFGNDGYGKPLRRERVFNIISFISVSACFISGRIVQYFVFDIYSSFAERPFETVIWCLIAGVAISAVLTWLDGHVRTDSVTGRTVILGLLLFGADLLLFNFFMPLVFDADIPDLILRTAVDVLTVTAGCLTFSLSRGKAGRFSRC